MKIDPVRENRTFLRAYRKGKKYAGKYCVIYALPRRRENGLRLGLTVTKARGCAVVRSRVRRILRAAWCETVKGETDAAPADIIIVARDAAVDAKSTDIAPEVAAGLLELGVIGRRRAERTGCPET